MASTVVLTHHHRDAMDNAAERGFWMPLPLPVDQLGSLRYLTCLSRAQGQIEALLEISSFEPWRQRDGQRSWLPFLGQRLQLPQPIPLGNRTLLQGWLPQHCEAFQLLDLQALLAAGRLSDLCSRQARSGGRSTPCSSPQASRPC